VRGVGLRFAQSVYANLCYCCEYIARTYIDGGESKRAAVGVQQLTHSAATDAVSISIVYSRLRCHGNGPMWRAHMHAWRQDSDVGCKLPVRCSIISHNMPETMCTAW